MCHLILKTVRANLSDSLKQKLFFQVLFSYGCSYQLCQYPVLPCIQYGRKLSKTVILLLKYKTSRKTGEIQIRWVVSKMGRKLADRSWWSMFSIFINDLQDAIDTTVTIFGHGTKLGGEVERTERKTILERNLDRLEE